MRRQKAFTLIEMMIVVAIVGIIASIAYPSYQDSVRKTRRADAQGALLKNASFLERYFTQNTCYKVKVDANCDATDANPTLPFAHSPPTGANFYYNVSVVAGDGVSYTLRATPIGTQATDGILEYSDTGLKGWDKNGDGDTADAGENTW